MFLISACGGILTDETGVITSPNFPSNYNHRDACVWKIVAPEGNQIVVSNQPRVAWGGKH